MRKMIIALAISAAFILSGISPTSLCSNQLTNTVWAGGDGGD
ncbi:MAG TPA: hypothetical protein VLK82_22290 [Candidatus Tectomicrobia bacterium]|nr:hypothetical protein [Candidatus Tectomicrobia bacterium]